MITILDEKRERYERIQEMYKSAAMLEKQAIRSILEADNLRKLARNLQAVNDRLDVKADLDDEEIT